jgi:hypothetical protein
LIILVIILGVFSIHPHHTLPVIVLVTIGISILFSRVYERICVYAEFGNKIAFVSLTGLVIIAALTMMHRAFLYNSEIFLRGFHGFELKYNTSLFYDRNFKKSLQGNGIILLTEECPNAWAVGSFAGVANYFGRPENKVEEHYVPRGTLYSRAHHEYIGLKSNQKKLVGLACHISSTPPYKIIDFSSELKPLQLGERVSFALLEKGAIYLGGGWSSNEDWGTWSNGADANILLPLHSHQATTILVEANPLLSPSHPKQGVEVKMNGVATSSVTLTANSGGRFEVAIPEEVKEKLRQSPILKLQLRFPDAARPVDIGINNDERKLAIGLVALTVK